MHHSLVSWEIILLYFFSWNFIWFGQKEPIKVHNFRLSIAEISQNLYLNRLLLLKVYKISAKKVSKICFSWHWTVMTCSKKKLIYCFKNDKNLLNFDLSTRNSQNFHCYWFLLWKVCTIWPIKVQRSYLSWHWRVMQNLNKNLFAVSKLTAIWWIFIRALKSLKKLHFD